MYNLTCVIIYLTPPTYSLVCVCIYIYIDMNHIYPGQQNGVGNSRSAQV
jgi:hypothetical protein